MKEKQPATIDGYIRSCPAASREKLQELRQLVHDAIPGVEERISYGVAAFFLRGKAFVWFGGYAKHIGFYPGAQVISRFKRELSGYRSAVGSVQLPLGEPLPAGLIRRMLRYRLGERGDG